MESRVSTPRLVSSLFPKFPLKADWKPPPFFFWQVQIWTHVPVINSCPVKNVQGCKWDSCQGKKTKCLIPHRVAGGAF